MDAASSDDCIEQLKRFGGKKYCWAKESDMLWKVEDDVELWFVEPKNVPNGGALQETADGALKLCL
jgi:hypothetical protein